MDFLTTALFALDNAGTEQLVGALLTRFDPANLLSRAKVVFATANELKTSDKIEPSGFKMDESGVLLSDTRARREMNQQLASYVETEVNSDPVTPPPALIDVVLYGAFYNASILVNAKEVAISKETEPILIPMSSLKVSNSSFNIYAPFKNSSGRFRTFSLIDTQTDENIPFVMAVPKQNAEKFGVMANVITPYSGIDLEDMVTYQVNAKLEPFYTFTGEAFCNYLAYNVAYCNIGLQVIDQMTAESKYVSDNEEEPVESYVRKIPKHNVLIECTCKKANLLGVLQCASDQDKLRDLLKDEESYITFVWVQKIYKASDKFEGDSLEVKLAAACTAMRRECKAQLLHYACELLAQRYYICLVGKSADCIEQVLSGGGVNGKAIKRIIG